MHYHIILTERCNLKCKYCYEKSMNEFDNGLDKKFEYDMTTPTDSKVKINKLKKFVKKDDFLIFYGGEPLVMIDKIKEIMDNLDCRFEMQTNGILLNQLPEKYLLKINKMLISIDGTKERTNFNRGLQKYETVLNNIKEIRQKGYQGEIVARMTLSFPDIFEQVKHLTALIEEGIFDSIHWQIDAGFYKFDFDEKKFSQFVEEYNSEIKKLIDWWIKEMENKKVWKLYPFLGVLNRLMKWDKNENLPCGSGHSNYTINTSGKISACPIMNSVKNFYCGDITKPKLKQIKITHKDCIKCSYFKICGGRCLYWRGTNLWPKKGNDLICKTIINLIEELKNKIPKINELIEKKIINKNDFNFEKYFGPEIIP